jgi:hypothetical protein
MVSVLLRRFGIIVMLFTTMVLLSFAACTIFVNTSGGYVSTLLNNSGRTLFALDSMQSLAERPAMSDADWVAEATAQVSTLTRLREEAQALEPPARFATFHQSYLSTLNALEQIGTTYEQAVEQGDAALLQQSVVQLQQSRSTLAALRGQMVDIREE